MNVTTHSESRSMFQKHMEMANLKVRIDRLIREEVEARTLRADLESKRNKLALELMVSQ